MRFGRAVENVKLSGDGPVVETIQNAVSATDESKSTPETEKIADKSSHKPRQVLSRKDRRRIETVRAAADVLRSRGFTSSGAVDGADVVGLAAWIMGDIEIAKDEATEASRALTAPPPVEIDGLRDELIAFGTWLNNDNGTDVDQDVDEYLRFRNAVKDSEEAEAAEDESDQITGLDVGREVQIVGNLYGSSGHQAAVGRVGKLVLFTTNNGHDTAHVEVSPGRVYTFPPTALRPTPPPF